MTTLPIPPPPPPLLAGKQKWLLNKNCDSLSSDLLEILCTCTSVICCQIVGGAYFIGTVEWSITCNKVFCILYFAVMRLTRPSLYTSVPVTNESQDLPGKSHFL